MATKAPLSKIALPTHHPAVMGCADGGVVHVVARKVKADTSKEIPTMDGTKPKGPRPPPVNTDFHVEGIEPVKSARVMAKKKSAMDVLKERQTGAEY